MELCNFFYNKNNKYNYYFTGIYPGNMHDSNIFNEDIKIIENMGVDIDNTIINCDKGYINEERKEYYNTYKNTLINYPEKKRSKRQKIKLFDDSIADDAAKCINYNNTPNNKIIIKLMIKLFLKDHKHKYYYDSTTKKLTKYNDKYNINIDNLYKRRYTVENTFSKIFKNYHCINRISCKSIKKYESFIYLTLCM